MTIRIVDLETTTLEPFEKINGVVEMGSVDLEEDTGQLIGARSYLVYPGRKISPESRAIHHISDDMVENSETLDKVWPKIMSAWPNPPYFAAHNAKFEMQWLQSLVPFAKWICTYKCALRIWPDAPNHQNYTIFYMLNIEVPGNAEILPAHRAGPDAIVTALILKHMLRVEGVALEQLLEWSSEPAFFRSAPIKFGKYKGKLWNEPPSDYWEWIRDKSDKDEDVKWNARQELLARQDVKEVYSDMALRAIATAPSVHWLNHWWKVDEAPHRRDYGITKGGLHYNELVAACAKRKKELEVSEPAGV